MSDPAAKAALRRHYRRLRQASLPAALAALQAAACRELPALVPPGRRLGLYWPVGSEPDLRALAALLPDRLALPERLIPPATGTAQRDRCLAALALAR
jgi:5-formyltetrahydrofolate cyclo-ligase